MPCFPAPAREEDDSLAQMMNELYSSLNRYEAGNLILTDDKAPVELLSMKAIDDIIAEEVDYYKDIYEEKGLKGLIDSF